MNLNTLSRKIYEDNKKKGFWDKNRCLPEILMLMVSECAEALEADRHNQYAKLGLFEILHHSNPDRFREIFEMWIKNSVEDEIADLIIRALDYCGSKKVDIQKHVDLKLRYNRLRKYKHGKRY